MKKTLFYLLPILLIAAMCVGLASCGDDDDVINIRREENNDKKDDNKDNYKYDDTSNPFTIEAIGSGTITFKNRATGCVMYKVNDGAVQSIAAGTNCQIPVSAGQKIMFFGNNATYYHNDEGSNISGTADFYAYGNIMSLITSTGYSTAKTLMGANTFSELFSESTHLKSHSAKPLLLPATTLTEGCYSTMFYNCYNLTTAPELPAKTLARDCYTCMFMGCSKLNYVKCLAEGINGSFDYESYLSCWLEDVSSSGTFIKASNSSWSSYYIPSSWTVINNGEEEPDEEEEQDDIYPDIQSTPLTLEAIAGGTFTFRNKATGSVIYKIDGGATQTIPANSTKTINVSAGQKVRFFGNNAAYATNHEDGNNSLISGAEDFYVYGNIMSLVNSTNFSTITVLAPYAFTRLFYGNKHLKNHPTNALILPALALATGCYSNMFYGCTSLTIAPELPATTLASSCYSYMFRGCTSLMTAPELPATTLTGTIIQDACYIGMFDGCTSLTTAPALPATTLTPGCYRSMFRGCTSLTTAPELPATTLASNCYFMMFYDCTSLTKAPELPATTLARYCYYCMFKGCTSLTKAPELPAKTLVSNCYSQMFGDCTNLSYVKCLATNITEDRTEAKKYISSWLYNVASTGTFVKAAGVTWPIGNARTTTTNKGIGGIPKNWTILSQ
jgi:hypothetical protein